MTNNPPTINPLSTKQLIPKLKLDTIANNQPNIINCQTSRIAALNCLSYTLRACHDKVNKDKNNLDNYLYDLQNTFNLTLQLIETILNANYSFHDSNNNNNNKEHKRILITLNSIKELYQKKLNLNNFRAIIRSKLLVDDQICQESKRRHNEMTSYYKDQVEGINDNLEKKSTLIKKFQKKFNEIEMYVISSSNPYYTNTQIRNSYHEIDSFIYFNDKYLREKPEYQRLIIQLKKGIDMIQKENMELRKRDNYSMQDESTQSNSQRNDNDKLTGIIQSYMKKNKHMIANNEQLKHMIKTIDYQLKLKNMKKTILEACKIEEGTGGELEESVYEDDDNINNNNALITGISNINQSDIFNKRDKKCITIGAWDISCIEKDNN